MCRSIVLPCNLFFCSLIFWANSLLPLIVLMNKQSKLLKAADYDHSMDSFVCTWRRQDVATQQPCTMSHSTHEPGSTVRGMLSP